MTTARRRPPVAMAFLQIPEGLEADRHGGLVVVAVLVERLRVPGGGQVAQHDPGRLVRPGAVAGDDHVGGGHGRAICRRVADDHLDGAHRPGPRRTGQPFAGVDDRATAAVERQVECPGDAAGDRRRLTRHPHAEVLVHHNGFTSVPGFWSSPYSPRIVGPIWMSSAPNCSPCNGTRGPAATKMPSMAWLASSGPVSFSNV